MITEDYVSYEMAKLLKEKGFDCAEITVVEQENGKDCYINNYYLLEPNELSANGYYAPTIQKVMKWLREVHNIFIDIDWNAQPEPKGFGDKPYFSLITNMNTNEFYSGKDLPGECASYEEACESAIKYCLENLI